MIRCKFCGQEYDENLDYCPNCGSDNLEVDGFNKKNKEEIEYKSLNNPEGQTLMASVFVKEEHQIVYFPLADESLSIGDIVCIQNKSGVYRIRDIKYLSRDDVSVALDFDNYVYKADREAIQKYKEEKKNAAKKSGNIATKTLSFDGGSIQIEFDLDNEEEREKYESYQSSSKAAVIFLSIFLPINIISLILGLTVGRYMETNVFLIIYLVCFIIFAFIGLFIIPLSSRSDLDDAKEYLEKKGATIIEYDEFSGSLTYELNGVRQTLRSQRSNFRYHHHH